MCAFDIFFPLYISTVFISMCFRYLCYASEVAYSRINCTYIITLRIQIHPFYALQGHVVLAGNPGYSLLSSMIQSVLCVVVCYEWVYVWKLKLIEFWLLVLCHCRSPSVPTQLTRPALTTSTWWPWATSARVSLSAWDPLKVSHWRPWYAFLGFWNQKFPCTLYARTFAF